MKTFSRCLHDSRHLWRIWLGLLLLSLLLPLAGVAMPLLERRLIDDVLLGDQRDLLLTTIVLYGGVWLLGMLLNVVSGLLRLYFTERLNMSLRHRLFAHCEDLSIEFSKRQHSGQTMSLFSSDVPAMANLLSTTVLGFVGTVMVLSVGIIVMLSLNWQLALVAGFVPLVVGTLAAWMTRPLRPAARRAQDKLAEVNQQLHESLAGMREVVAFGQEQPQEARFTKRLNELLRLRIRIGMIDAGLQTGQSLLGMAVTLVILGYGGYLVMEGQTTLGTLIAMRSLFMRVLSPAQQLAGLFGGAQKFAASADRVYAFLDERPRVQERDGARAPVAVAGRIEFEGVQFSYSGDRPILRDISFVAQSGEVVALVGPSGAGKSTLVSLIARFHDPERGRILLDGVDLRELTLAGLRRQIGMVFQDTFLFAGTIRDNIALGDNHATDEQIIAAAQAAHAWDFIDALPEGLNTPVGERGLRLSEGQKQRIAIARALLRDPRILILDEPTSALDARSEHLLQAALNNLMRGRTTFVIAHRLATIQRADRILVLDGGEIVEQGTSADLLARAGLYRSLYDLQIANGHDAGSRLDSTMAESVRSSVTHSSDIAVIDTLSN